MTPPYVCFERRHGDLVGTVVSYRQLIINTHTVCDPNGAELLNSFVPQALAKIRELDGDDDLALSLRI